MKLKTFSAHLKKPQTQWMRGSDNPLIARSHVKWTFIAPHHNVERKILCSGHVLFIMSHGIECA